MKIYKSIIPLILSIIVIINFNVIHSYAYDSSSYKYDNGYYYVDNLANHTTDNHITLYVLVPNDGVLEGTLRYDFKCLSNNFKDSSTYNDLGYQLLRYEYRFDTKTEIDKVGSGILIPFNFCLENGKYIFSTNDYSNGLCVLTPDYKNPLNNPIDISSEESYTKSIVEYPVEIKNQTISLYSILGDEDFINNNAKALSDYAKGVNTDNENVSDSYDKVEAKKELSDVLTKVGVSSEDVTNILDELVDDSPTIDKNNVDTNNSSNSTDNVQINNIKETGNNDKNTTNTKMDIKTIIIVIVGTIILILVVLKVRRERK